MDYNPHTLVAAGLCRINGHPCWLKLDTGWAGVSLYAGRAHVLGVDVPPTVAKGQAYASVRVDLNLQESRPLGFRVPASILAGSDADRTSTGQPICGILGAPFLDTIPTEWNVPAHKVVFWLRGRPRDFRHVPRRMTLRGTLVDLHRLVVPVRVGGRRGQALLDTGADYIYLPDALISEFPSAGADGTASGPTATLRFTPRAVEGLRLGPLTLAGTMLERLPGRSPGGPPASYGLVGMVLISHLHLFVIGDKILFDPREKDTRFHSD